jgi:hypothetical protein
MQWYMDALTASKSPPFYWSFHDYADVTYESGKHQTQFPQLRHFERELHERYPKDREHVYLDEQGVLLEHGGNKTPLWSSEENNHAADQQRAAHRLTQLENIDKHNVIGLLAYYEVFWRPQLCFRASETPAT